MHALRHVPGRLSRRRDRGRLGNRASTHTAPSETAKLINDKKLTTKDTKVTKMLLRTTVLASFSFVIFVPFVVHF